MHNEIARLLGQSATIAGFILAAGGACVLLGRKAHGSGRNADNTTAEPTPERWPGGLEAWRAERDQIVRELCMEATEAGVTAAVEALLDPVLGERIEGARRLREKARSN